MKQILKPSIIYVMGVVTLMSGYADDLVRPAIPDIAYLLHQIVCVFN